jgi:ketosteroid isomerase-like protein
VDGCEECLAAGTLWLHLRICLECGHVACCDESPYRHANGHANATGHPIIRSLEPGELWSWCYSDRIAMLTPEVTGTTRLPPSPTLQRERGTDDRAYGGDGRATGGRTSRSWRARQAQGYALGMSSPPPQDSTEESTTPDLVELVRRSIEAAARRDFDAAMSVYSPRAIWDMSRLGLGNYEGSAAIRALFEDWMGAYEELEIEIEEILDIGRGVTIAVVHQGGCPVGSTGYVQLRFASVVEWNEGMIDRMTNYTDIDEARAAAARLAKSRR